MQLVGKHPVFEHLDALAHKLHVAVNFLQGSASGSRRMLLARRDG